MGASTAIDPALVERFAKALGRLNPDGGKIGLAVSGGPDSMAMLLLAQEAIPGGFEVATVDHGLRPEAKDECALVVAACEERGVPCEVLSVTVGEGNVQAKAREARYLAIDHWAYPRGIDLVATAHHADDQAETLLMRLNRGSGVSGLAGIRESGTAFFAFKLGLIRPLLGFRRAELESVCRLNAISTANDPSNWDDRYDRVRIRNALADSDWIDPLALARAASNLGDAEEALFMFTRRLWDERVTFHQGSTPIDRVYRLEPDIGAEMEIRLVAEIFGKLGGRFRGSELGALIETLRRGGKGNLGGILASAEAKRATAVAPVWVFRPEPPRKTG